ncbi:MAG: type II secretion system minor pseudopilin GspK [Thermodesulfovibrionales bacterium]
MNYLRNQNGIALIVTLLVLAIITAMVVEFAYGVYTGTNNLYNWRDSQRLSLMARSGVNVSARLVSDWLNNQNYTPGFIEMPIENPFEDFKGTITVRIEDENSKFNVNTIINQRGEKDTYGYDSFIRLLEALLLDKKIADRVLDWIDNDSIANLPDSETNAKNLPFVSVDEMLLINGITRKDYDTLLPYVTVFGDGKININGAEKPVLRSLSGISDVLAQTVIDYRKNTPFDGTEKILKVSGFEGPLGTSLMGHITVQGGAFYISSIAQSSGVKRIIETKFLMSKSTSEIKYWKEY